MIRSIDDVDEDSKMQLLSSVYFVESSSFETFNLWMQHKDHWEQIPAGFGLHIGNIVNDKDLPVVVSFNFNLIHGSRVCFYHATSNYVDHDMVKSFIHQFCGKYQDRWKTCDANNFHQADNYCATLHKKK